MVRIGSFALALLVLAANVFVVSSSALASTYREGPFTCTVPILDPNAVVSRGVVTHSRARRYDTGFKNASSDVDLFGRFKRDFGARATFTLPANPSNRGLFYSNWVLLKPLKGEAFVQVELMRWKKYHYRDEIGLTWALPDGRLVYRDTEVWLSDAPHRLGIAERGGVVSFDVDGATICTAPAQRFFTAKDQLYYQLGTEVARYGDHPTGTVSHIEIKDDRDTAYHRVTPTCVYRGYGTSWEYDGRGRFHAAGVFDPTAPYLKFTGLRWDRPCTF